LTGFCPGSKCCHTTSTPPQQVPCACHHIKSTQPHPIASSMSIQR
jgi:hypothetical protein